MWFAHSKINHRDFKDKFWRKQPVQLAHNLQLPEIERDLSKERIFSLCAEELVESRLIETKDDNYILELGPLDIQRLPDQSILILQSLDSHIGSVARLLSDHFAFLPRWRIDDVMASYGTASGSCGPHFDHYDVFLLQIRGSKLWHLDEGDHSESDLLPHSDLRLLADFKASTEIDQQPGDVLYIPPGIGHWGVASDDSLTLSVGIRNPTLNGLISNFADAVGDLLPAMETLDDALDLDSQITGIQRATSDRITNRLTEVLSNSDYVERWFGAYMTELREPELIDPPDRLYSLEDVSAAQATPSIFSCHLASRLAHQTQGNVSLVFINGESFQCQDIVPDWFKTLETERSISNEGIDTGDDDLIILMHLLNSGAVSSSVIAG